MNILYRAVILKSSWESSIDSNSAFEEHEKRLCCKNNQKLHPTKGSNTLKQFVSKLPTDCLSVFDYSVGLALKGLIT